MSEVFYALRKRAQIDAETARLLGESNPVVVSGRHKLGIGQVRRLNEAVAFVDAAAVLRGRYDVFAARAFAAGVAAFAGDGGVKEFDASLRLLDGNRPYLPGQFTDRAIEAFEKGWLARLNGDVDSLGNAPQNAFELNGLMMRAASARVVIAQERAILRIAEEDNVLDEVMQLHDRCGSDARSLPEVVDVALKYWVANPPDYNHAFLASMSTLVRIPEMARFFGEVILGVGRPIEPDSFNRFSAKAVAALKVEIDSLLGPR